MKKKIIILTCILLPILFFVVYCYSFDYYAFKDYELKIPRSINKNTIIYHDGIDITAFQIMKYENEVIQEVIKHDFKKINVEELNKIYEKAIKGDLFKYLNEDEKQAFLENFNKEKLFNPDNYYLFYEDTEEAVYEFVLFIIDTKENKLYYIISA